MQADQTPPRFFLRFFRWYCHPMLVDHIEGDLIEVHRQSVKTIGKRKADLKFVVDVLLLFRPGIIRPVKPYKNVNAISMYKSYFRIGWRNLLKNKVHSFINIGGLATGMAVAMLIGLWVYDEISYNRYHENYHKVAKVIMVATDPATSETRHNTGLWLPIEDILRDTYGQYFEHVATVWYTGTWTLKKGDNNFRKTGNFLGSEILEMLSLEMIKGSTSSLADPHSIVISESTAKALFGDSNPLEQTIKIDNRMDAMVTGVYRDMPKNSIYGELDFIAPFELWKISNPWVQNGGWNSASFNFLVQLAPHVSMEQASAAIKDLFQNNGPPELQREIEKYKPAFYLYPMKDWHLYSDFENGYPAGGRITYVWLFGIIGAFVFLLACINFMNLSTARSEKRAREVGIRKVVGSVRIQLISQFFMESYLMVLLSFAAAIILVSVSINLFNQIADKNIVLPYPNPYFWLMALIFISITGLLSGVYPAFFLSSFQPVKILKGTVRTGKLASLPRKILVVVQFTVSVSLVIGTLVVYKQIQYAQSRPIGYERNGLVTVPLNDPDYYGKRDVLKTALLNTGMVTSVCFTFSPITAVWDNEGGYDWEGKDPERDTDFAICQADHDFGKTVNWEVIEGRDFSEDFASDTAALIINESAVKYIGFKDPVGKQIYQENNPAPYTIIGVVKDLVMMSPYEPVKQTLFFLGEDRVNHLNFRLKPSVVPGEAIARINAVVKEILPSVMFSYSFVDEDYAAKFRAEQRISTLSTVFSVLAIFISCLGLFGLASYVAEQRTKEIGIRKVLGASVINLWRMLSKDFVVLVMISCAIAAPITYYFMEAWLQQYSYHTEMSLWTFISSCTGMLLITLFTVSYQAIRASVSNPVKSIRTE